MLRPANADAVCKRSRILHSLRKLGTYAGGTPFPKFPWRTISAPSHPQNTRAIPRNT